MLWEWANDPQVRTASFSMDSIPWERHLEWFRSKMDDPRCIFWIPMIGEGIPVGQVRFDIRDVEAEISVSIDHEFRGRGYGCMVILRSSEELFGMTKVALIHAYVKPGNLLSIRAFKKAGYQYIGLERISGDEAIRLDLARGEGRDSELGPRRC